MWCSRHSCQPWGQIVCAERYLGNNLVSHPHDRQGLFLHPRVSHKCCCHISHPCLALTVSSVPYSAEWFAWVSHKVQNIEFFQLSEAARASFSPLGHRRAGRGAASTACVLYEALFSPMSLVGLCSSGHTLSSPFWLSPFPAVPGWRLFGQGRAGPEQQVQSCRTWASGAVVGVENQVWDAVRALKGKGRSDVVLSAWGWLGLQS